MDTPVAQWELALRPWRAASTGVSLIQLPFFAASLLFLARSEVDRAIVAAVVYGLLEGVKWVVETEAIRRNPDADFESFYRAAPLPPSQRTFLKVLVLATPLEVAVFGATFASTFDLSFWPTALFVAVFALSWIVPIERVRRRGSWLAMTRLPSRSRRIPDPAVKESSPATHDERTRGRKVLRWFLIILLPFVIVAVLFLLLALLAR